MTKMNTTLAAAVAVASLAGLVTGAQAATNRPAADNTSRPNPPAAVCFLSKDYCSGPYNARAARASEAAPTTERDSRY